jgi:cell division protease FtsH
MPLLDVDLGKFVDDLRSEVIVWGPLLLLAFFVYVMWRLLQAMPKASAPETIDAETTQVRWDDVAGVEEPRAELMEVVEFLRDPERFKRLGAKVPRGVLLYGPPGTGKTLLAKAVAGESGAAFFATSASAFVEMFIGLGAARIRRLFTEARKHAPAIIFIDEIDAVGAARSTNSMNRESDQTLNQLLVELDGFAGDDGVIVMGSTNRLEGLDKALLRPGRFDRQILVPPPDLGGRRAILAAHTRGKPLGPDVDLDAVARATVGLTGADLANIANEAAIRAARENATALSRANFDEALERVVAGLASHHVLTGKEKRITAYHEAGHALLAHLLGLRPVHKVTIVPRGGALGYVMSLPEEDRFLSTREELIDDMSMSLGGRVAEILTFGRISSGAIGDLERVTAIARMMVCELGMGSIVESRQLPADDYSLSEETRRLRDAEQERLATQAFEEAHRLLSLHQGALERLAQKLLEVESLDRAELEALLADVPPERSRSNEVGQVLGVAAAREARRRPAG